MRVVNVVGVEALSLYLDIGASVELEGIDLLYKSLCDGRDRFVTAMGVDLVFLKNSLVVQWLLLALSC